MVNVIKINDNISIEVKKSEFRTVITLNRNGEKIILSDSYTDYAIMCDVAYDDNYIVVYTKDNTINQFPLEIECAYNIKTNTFFNVRRNSKLAENLEMMLINKRMFNIAPVILWLNQKDIELGFQDETARFISYLTNDNKNITKDEIVSYILKEYPVLSNYLGLTLTDCKKVINDIGGECLFLHKIPQIIDKEEDKIQPINISIVGIRNPNSISSMYFQSTTVSNMATVRRKALENRYEKLKRARVS